MQHLADLPTPALLLDRFRLERNVRRMAERTRALGWALRPHAKTHKSPPVAALQLAAGAAGLTVATLAEARAFIDAGFEDLTWAFPVILGRVPEIRRLSERATLRLLVDSETAIAALEDGGHRGPVWLKVDCGYHRAGVDPETPGAVELARRLAESSALEFDGILTHAGHAYATSSPTELAAVAAQERDVMIRFAERLRAEGLPVPGVSIGSTPTLSVEVASGTGITEARPGNYVFYDYLQCILGSCAVADCAVSLLASVVSGSRELDHSIVDAGALALSKDAGHPRAPFPTCGRIYSDYEAAELDADRHLAALSQEHGHVAGYLPIGSRVRILPNHSCLAVAQFDEYVVVEGERVVDRWPIRREREGRDAG